MLPSPHYSPPSCWHPHLKHWCSYELDTGPSKRCSWWLWAHEWFVTYRLYQMACSLIMYWSSFHCFAVCWITKLSLPYYTWCHLLPRCRCIYALPFCGFYHICKMIVLDIKMWCCITSGMIIKLEPEAGWIFEYSVNKNINGKVNGGFEVWLHNCDGSKLRRCVVSMNITN